MGECFDTNLTLLFSTRSFKKEKASSEPYVPKHDLKMKEGQTIRINIKVQWMDAKVYVQCFDFRSPTPEQKGRGRR